MLKLKDKAIITTMIMRNNNDGNNYNYVAK